MKGHGARCCGQYGSDDHEQLTHPQTGHDESSPTAARVTLLRLPGRSGPLPGLQVLGGVQEGEQVVHRHLTWSVVLYIRFYEKGNYSAGFGAVPLEGEGRR
jgi:hypothetical protein